MAIDPNANAEYWASKNIVFAVGQVVWVSGIEFNVVGIVPISETVPKGQLILQPVTAMV